MQSSAPPSPRPLLMRLFVSPDEPRLRAGWRLLLHIVLVGVLSLVFTLVLALVSPLLDATGLQPSILIPARDVWLYMAQLLAITVATWVARRFLDRRSFVSLGFGIDRHALPDLMIGFALPALLIGLVFLLEWGMGWLQFESVGWQTTSLTTWMPGMLGMLGMFILVGFQEELLSRGYQLQNMAAGLNLPWALLLSSSVFALLHLANPHASWASILGILVAGYFFAFPWLRTGRLWLSIGLHTGWNFFEGTVFGFPVSGLGGFHLISQTVQGPAPVTGGDFGPEAGLIILPAMAIGAAFVWLYTRCRRPPAPSTTGGEKHTSEAHTKR